MEYRIVKHTPPVLKYGSLQRYKILALDPAARFLGWQYLEDAELLYDAWDAVRSLQAAESQVNQIINQLEVI
jgi:hypothetical protein